MRRIRRLNAFELISLFALFGYLQVLLAGLNIK